MCLHTFRCFLVLTVANLTTKVLFGLSYMLKDHKTKPLGEKLMTITPLRNITSDTLFIDTLFYHFQVTAELEKIT